MIPCFKRWYGLQKGDLNPESILVYLIIPTHPLYLVLVTPSVE
jgi:hypothetical protein